MTLRGIISPPRSRSSPRERRPNNNNNAATKNPPSKPKYQSPSRRAINPNDLQRSLRKETPQCNAVKPTPKRPTKTNNTEKSSPNTSRIVSSRRQIAAPNPSDKKLENNNNPTPKTATKISNTRPSSSPRTTRPIISQPSRGPTGSSKSSNVKGVNGCRSDVSGGKVSDMAKDSRSQKFCDSRNESSPKQLPSYALGHQTDVKVGDVVNQNHYATLGDPDVRDQLQRISIDGKDLADIVLHANSVYQSIGSDTKEEDSSQSNAQRIFQIYKEIASHRQGTNLSITSYFTELMALWDELATYSDLPQCSCGSIEKLSEHMEREKVMQFLVGLNDSYSTICSQILLTRPFPTVEKAYSVIIREEKRRELVLSLEIVAAKVMQNNWLLQNGHSSSNNGDSNDGIEEVGNNLNELQVDQNEVTSFSTIEPLLIDLGSPVRC